MSIIYDVLKEDLMVADVDLVTDVINVALMGSGHVETVSDQVWGNVSAQEIAGTAYVAGGQVLANKTVTLLTPTSTWDADDSTWLVATFSAFYAVIYDITNTSSLICSINFGGAQSVVAGTFTIEWDSAGIISLT